MDVQVRLCDLAVWHPKLLWGEIGAAALAVLGSHEKENAVVIDLSVENVPSFGTGHLQMNIEASYPLAAQVDRLRKTYEASRLVELAAIAITGAGLYYAGRHEIHNFALRGSAADYLVDDESILLEIAGRSRRRDASVAWQSRWGRLSETHSGGVIVSQLTASGVNEKQRVDAMSANQPQPAMVPLNRQFRLAGVCGPPT
ncbi:MAG TPA: hypothetical protein PK867_12335 [Pirellulales bacterium]|nr:hypothetical protein [Pirellulales bacterium]